MIVLAFLIALPAGGASEEPAGDPPPALIGMEYVVERARVLAQAAYDGVGATAPEALRALTKDQWEKIAFRPDETLWRDDQLPFEIGFHHAGFIYNQVAAISIIDGETLRPLTAAADFFDYPNAEMRETAAQANAGFAGFFVRPAAGVEKGAGAPDNAPELLTFLGASYFRSRGRHSRYGSYARGLAVDTALANGEEFPYFREFWIVKPGPEDASLTIFALMDSPRLTGALRFEAFPGTTTVMDVEATLFARAGATPPDKIGLAPLTSMFLFSETSGAHKSDYRPEVHDADGLLYTDGDGQWHWTPLANPDRLVINRFETESLRGFGLLQRDDNFDHYQDPDSRFDRRSSVWVEPAEPWGPGHVELVEIPGSEDYHGNIVAFWVPKANGKPVPAETRPNGQPPPAPVAAIAYKLHWMTTGACPHNLGRAVATRMRLNEADNTAELYIDFEGERLNAVDAATGLASVVELPEHFSLVEKRLFKNEVTSGWRLVLIVRLPQKDGLLKSLFTGSADANRARFKALLKQGDNIPDPLTETWVYDFLP